MFVNRRAAWPGLAWHALGSAVGTGLCATLLVATPAQAATQSRPVCAAAWNAAVACNGNSASELGVNHTANGWAHGDDPARVVGNRQPWTSQGACDGTDPGSAGKPGGLGKSGNPKAPARGVLFSPYKDVTINLDWNTHVMRSAVAGKPIPVAGHGGLVSTVKANLGAITLAFAAGECGSETWGGIPAASFASANIQSLVDAGVSYVVSTGGQAGSFTCSTPAGMAQFLSQYASPYLVGLDFDIEGDHTQQQIDDLISNAAYAHTLYPKLRFSFTLATLAASDGSHDGLSGVGGMVVRAVKAANLPNYTINLMVMDFGPASPRVCVMSNGQCDMGQSAIQGALNLEHAYSIPASRIELTPMIGANDVSGELFTIADADTLINYAVGHGMAGVHFWSLDRDTPCPGGSGAVSTTCNSVSGSSPLQYTHRFLHDLGR